VELLSNSGLRRDAPAHSGSATSYRTAIAEFKAAGDFLPLTASLPLSRGSVFFICLSDLFTVASLHNNAVPRLDSINLRYLVSCLVSLKKNCAFGCIEGHLALRNSSVSLPKVPPHAAFEEKQLFGQQHGSI
jgi:hypothetical protein